jgi:hypothetical protein
MQTAVEWLIQKIQSEAFCDHVNGVVCLDYDKLSEFLEEAKDMEKDQIEKAYGDGYDNGQSYVIVSCKTYYNETYTNK